MSNFLKKTKKVISTAIVLVIMIVTGKAKTLAVDTTKPTVTPKQSAGEIEAGSELKFNIEDDDRITYIFYGWNRRIDNNNYELYTLATPTTPHEFKINAPTTPGLYEFSIAAQDYTGNISTWMNIPYVVKNRDELSGVKDNEEPKFIFNVENGEYPYSNDIVEKGRSIKFSIKDDSGVYYIGYKWSKDEKSPSYTSGATYIYNQDVIEINAPTEVGTWYLQLYARDGADNLSKCYYTKLIVVDDLTEQDIKIDATSSLIYDGEEKTVEATMLNGKQADITISYEGNRVNVGTFKAIITATGKENCIGTVPIEKVYEITAADISEADVSVEAPNNLVYDGQAKEVTATMLNGRTADVTITYFGENITEGKAIEAGEYTATITAVGNGNYKGNIEKTIQFTIFTKATEADLIGNLVSTDYTVETWTAFKGAIDTALEKTIKSEYDVAIEAVNAARKELNKATVDTSAVDNYVASLTSTDYTNWAEFTAVVDSVKAETLQSVFNSRVSEVTGFELSPKAIVKTVLMDYKLELEALIKEDYTNYTEIMTAIDELLLNDTIKLQSAFDEKVADIKAISLTPKSIVKTTLMNYRNELIALKEEDYTNYTEIMTAINNLLVDNTITLQSKFDAKVAEIKAIELKQATLSKQQIAAIDAKLNSLVKTDYTNWEIATEAVNRAKIALPSQYEQKLAEIDEAIKQLEVKSFEKTELESVNETLKTLNKDDYTEASWVKLQNNISLAEGARLKSQYDAVKEQLTVDKLVRNTVSDKIAPEIHISEGYSSIMSFAKGNVKFDFDKAVYVKDNSGETINATYTTNLKSDDIGEYEVIYSAVDSAGNQADEVIITIKITDLAPIISYYNEDNISAVIPSGNGTFFTRHITVFADKGTMTISKNGVEIGTFAGEKELIEDGIYTIKAVADGCPSSEKTFVIDTSKPTVSGVKTKRYTRIVTFSFSDENGIGKATLTKIDFNPETDAESEREIDLTGLNSYTVDKNGEYELRIEDIYGNAIDPITFTVKI